MVSDSKIFSQYDSHGPVSDLPFLATELLRSQKETWNQLSEAYASLSAVRTKEIKCETFAVRIQHNPLRMTSTAAKVDVQSVSRRKCFLCTENFPPVQKGILYDNEYLVLTNPAPIFAHHYTIASVHHIPQAIGKNIRTFLSLAKDMSPLFGVFYNGPRCGASAPDHLHFQVSPLNGIPVEREAAEPSRRIFIKNEHHVDVITLRNFGREVIVLEGGSIEGMETVFWAVMESLKEVSNVTEEPMMNVHGSYHKNFWRLIIFPRRKHRPDIYYHKENERILVSPALVDLGGLIIVPVEKDFERLEASIIENILREVSLEQGGAEFIVRHL